MSCNHWHHCGPPGEPYRYPYGREAEMYPPRRRRFERDIEGDLRDYLEYLESEVAGVRRELEDATARGETSS